MPPSSFSRITSAPAAGLFVVPLVMVPVTFVAARNEAAASRMTKINCNGLVMNEVRRFPVARSPTTLPRLPFPVLCALSRNPLLEIFLPCTRSSGREDSRRSLLFAPAGRQDVSFRERYPSHHA